MKKLKRNGKNLLKNIKNYFKLNKELWIDNLKKLDNYIIENRKLPSNKSKDKNIKILGGWLSNEKTKYKNKTNIMKDEDIRNQFKEFIEKYKELF